MGTLAKKVNVDAARPAPRTFVRPWCEADAAAWDAYVRAHERATFFHQAGWKRVLERAFGYPAHYLLAERNGRVLGVLPLFACRDIRGRRGLYSLPHTIYGGPVADDAATERALLEEARALGRHLGAARLELRNRYATSLELPTLEGFATFEKELPEDPDLVYRTLPKKSREAVNQAVKRHKLEVDLEGGLDVFWSLLAASFHRLGTPVFPRRLFEVLREEFPDTSGIVVARHVGRPVSAVLYVTFREVLLALYSGEAPEVRQLKSNNFKYLRLMEHAVARGFRRFDFGRSRSDNEGAVRFKQNQGYAMEALPYQVEPAPEDGRAGPDPNQGFFSRARRLWSRLPAGLATRLGPRVVRYFP